MLATKLFGVPFLPEEEDHPVCSACGAPLYNLFQVNFQEAGYNLLPGCDLLVFYFCFQCNPLNSREPGWEIRAYQEPEKKILRRSLSLPPVPDQFSVAGMIFPVGEFWMTARYTHLADLPSGFFDQGIRANVTRNELAHERYTEYLFELRGGDDCHVISKIGGWLEDWQGPYFTRCACGAELAHIVTIATTNHTPWVAGDRVARMVAADYALLADYRDSLYTGHFRPGVAWSRAYTFLGTVRGLPFLNNTASVVISRSTGNIASFAWNQVLGKVRFPTPEGILAPREALRRYLEMLGLELVYVCSKEKTAREKPRAWLVYRLKSSSQRICGRAHALFSRRLPGRGPRCRGTVPGLKMI
ncbi:MAG: hypothetical protein AB1652_09385 [Bacillota bacterium]